MTMDPCTAAGINNAFRDVEALVDAVDEGLSGRELILDALSDYHELRDEVGLPIYGLTRDLAAFGPPSAEMVSLLGALAGNRPQTDRFIGVLAQTVSPREFFAPQNVGQIIASAKRQGSA
jgi:2-polyprenyl-6-methoxyphenol hydroxylase-like FAD-dependent oxidoreductase